MLIDGWIASNLRSNPEFQSSLVRIGLWLFGLLYIGLGAITGYYGVDLTYYYTLFSVYLGFAIAVLVSVLRQPVWPARRYVVLVVDIAAISLAIFLTREAISPFYLLYIWVFISYGTRYGRTHLIVASISSVLAYNLVLVNLGEWQRHTFEAAFFLLLLVVLPLYQYSLLRKVQEARQEAERANQARGDFLATMTHELRTPLSGVIGLTQLLGSTKLTAEQEEYVHSIASSANLLRALIGDVLDLSKIDARKLRLESIPFDLCAAVLDVCHALVGQALDKGLELVCQIDSRLPREVVGDQLRVRQILFNLIGNAIKFTEQGEVFVRVSVQEAQEDLPVPHVLMAIQDTGIGIPPDKLQQIFQSFWQAEDSTTRRFGGTGLGTTIARDLTRLMGGRIGVESEPDHGSTFWVKLPLLGAGFRPQEPVWPSMLNGLRALVFETNATSRDVIIAACEEMGTSCQTLDNIGQLSQLAVQRDAIDLIIVADSPAGEDLIGVLNLLHHVLGKQVPSVLLGYGSRRLDVERACHNCVIKPFFSGQLSAVMERALQSGDLRSALQVAEPRTGQGPRVSPGIGGQYVKVLVAEDNAIAAKVITTLLERDGHQVTLVRNGKEAQQQARQAQFDIAFVDLRMPKIDGIEFTRQYRNEEPEGRKLPIIALTANAAEDIQQECLEVGMDDFLTKPVDPGSLSAIIRRFVPPAS